MKGAEFSLFAADGISPSGVLEKPVFVRGV